MTFDATKKRVISARNSTHMEWGEKGADREKAVDRVTAYSLSSVGRRRLGDYLWRLKYGRETGLRDLVRPAVLLLEKMFQDPNDKRHSRVVLALIACALTEWLHDQCPKCGGRGRLGAGREVLVTTRVVCGSCAGAGRIFYESSMVKRFKLHGAIAGNEVPEDARRDKLCYECLGHGGKNHVANKYSRLRACPLCHGTGRRRMDDKRRAMEIGMPPKTFAKWRPHYLAVLRELRATDGELAMRVDFRLGRLENPPDDLDEVADRSDDKNTFGNDPVAPQSERRPDGLALDAEGKGAA